MRIMDCVLVLFRKKLDTVVYDPERNCAKPSWGESLKVSLLLYPLVSATVSKYEFKLSKYEFKLSKYEFKLSKYEFKLSKYEFKLSKYEFKLSKYEFKLSKYEFKLSKYEFKLSKYEFKLSKYEFKLSNFPVPLYLHIFIITLLHLFLQRGHSMFALLLLQYYRLTFSDLFIP